MWSKLTNSSIIPCTSYAVFTNPLQPEGECFSRKLYEKSDTVSEFPCPANKRSASGALRYIALHYVLGTVRTPVWVPWGCLLACTNSSFSSSLRVADCGRHNPHQKAMIVSAKWMVNQREVASTSYHSVSSPRLQALTLLRYLLAGEMARLAFAPSLSSSSWPLKPRSSPSSSFAVATLKSNATVCNEPLKKQQVQQTGVFFCVS